MRQVNMLLLALTVAFLVGCTSHRGLIASEKVTIPMSWECGIPQSMHDVFKEPSRVGAVTLHFADHPNVVDIEFQAGLCDALKAAGRSVVPVVVAPTRSRTGGKLTGYTVLSINGLPMGPTLWQEQTAASKARLPPLRSYFDNEGSCG